MLAGRHMNGGGGRMFFFFKKKGSRTGYSWKNALGRCNRDLYMIVRHCQGGWSTAQALLHFQHCCDSYSLRTGKSGPKA
jgi:hypothetical protein